MADTIKGTLESHNKLRAQCGAPPLVWDDGLAGYAKQAASKCQSGGVMQVINTQHRKNSIDIIYIFATLAHTVELAHLGRSVGQQNTHIDCSPFSFGITD